MPPPKKKTPRLETVINTCGSIIKQHWKKMTQVQQECDFLFLRIQHFVRKVKHFVRKSYMKLDLLTWITNYIT